MDRAYLSGASATAPTPPASPSIGYPTAGSPGISSPTLPGPYFYHMLVEEIRTVITDAGLTPDQSNLAQLSQAIRLFSLPASSVIHVAKNSAPTGFIKANGSAISRTAYATLFAAIGTTFGVGDGSTTFNLPDLRGEFLRGWDDARGVDSGRILGSAQLGAIESHFHSTTTSYVTAGSGTGVAAGQGTLVQNQNTGTSGGSETRPRNIALLACIKY